MSANAQFVVDDIFAFRDGRTVFTGTVEDHPEHMTLGLFEMIIDGESSGFLTIEGEMINSGAHPGHPTKNIRRSISTMDPFHLDRAEIENRQLVLRRVPQIENRENKMHRHLLGLVSPPREFVPDPMTLGPVLPEGWDGDAWTGNGYFLRAWNKDLGRVAYSTAATYAETRRQLLAEIASGGRPAENLVKTVATV